MRVSNLNLLLVGSSFPVYIVPGNSLSVTQEETRQNVWSNMHVCVHKVTLVGLCLLQLQFPLVFETFPNEICRRHCRALTVTFTKTLALTVFPLDHVKFASVHFSFPFFFPSS